MRKRLISLAAAAAMMLSSLSCCLTAFAEEKKPTETYYYCILSLYEKPIAQYSEAQKNGVNKFILTDNGKAAYNKIKNEQKKVQKKVNSLIGREAEFIYGYTAAANGLSVKLTEKEYRKVERNITKLGAEFIFVEGECDDSGLSEPPEYAAPTAPTAEDAENSKNSENNDDRYYLLEQELMERLGVGDDDRRGEGMVIGIVDVEFNSEHELFTLPEGVKGRITKADIQAAAPYLNAAGSVKKMYKTEKVPFSFDYENKDSNTAPLDKETAHGTSVASAAAGYYGTSQNDKDSFKPTGTAPAAQLMLMQVESLMPHSEYAAYDDLLYLGADVINCSFGFLGADACSSSNYMTYRRRIFENIKKREL